MLVHHSQGQDVDTCGDIPWQIDRIGDGGGLPWREVFRLLEELLREQFNRARQPAVDRDAGDEFLGIALIVAQTVGESIGLVTRCGGWVIGWCSRS